MSLQLLLGLFLTILPVFELRGGLPIVIDYCLKHGLSIWPYFFLVLVLNILMILVIFFFLDYLHEHFMKIRIYRKIMGRVLNRIWKKVDKVKTKMDNLGFFALFLFVAVPLPGTGAWSGSLVAWAMRLNRVKSFIAISLGVALAGFLILFASLGILR